MKQQKEDHKFIPIDGMLNGKKQFIVKCKKTCGEFLTASWNKEGFKRNKCPCCGERIKK